MPARELNCKIIQKVWLTPTVLSIRFEPARKIAFQPGQFLSIVVPPALARSARRVRRIYSFADARERGYELCIKMTGGPGSSYMASLGVGDIFRASAPYGDFVYQPRSGRSLCFVATGTGIAPFRAMALSKLFSEDGPEEALMLFGARDESEILYPGEFERAGVREVHALSRPGAEWHGFKGRVTDYLASLPSTWNWQGTDFYLCGSGDMVADVRRMLRHSRGVDPRSIFQEVYFNSPKVEVDSEESASAG